MPHQDILRNDFAKTALTGLLANVNTEQRLEVYASKFSLKYIEVLAKISFDIADAMVHEESHR